MRCENSFCIYLAGEECILDAIEINSMGMCTECIYPNIDENVLSEAKRKLLEYYAEADA